MKFSCHYYCILLHEFVNCIVCVFATGLQSSGDHSRLKTIVKQYLQWHYNRLAEGNKDIFSKSKPTTGQQAGIDLTMGDDDGNGSGFVEKFDRLPDEQVLQAVKSKARYYKPTIDGLIGFTDLKNTPLRQPFSECGL